MTEYDSSNTHKATIQGDNGVQVTVVRNLSTPQDFSSNALWLKREFEGQNGSSSTGYYDTYGIEAARELHKNIGIVLTELDDITESAKPKSLTRDALTDLPTGTSVYENKRRYVKTSVDTFVKISDPASDPYLSVGTLYTYGELDGLVYAEEVN